MRITALTAAAFTLVLGLAPSAARAQQADDPELDDDVAEGASEAPASDPPVQIVVPIRPPPPAAPAAPRLRLIVIDVATHGVDPVVGHVATLQMRETGAAMGYEVLDARSTVAAAQQLRMPYPPTPADLWRVTWVAQSQRGAFARVWADQGQYVIEVAVASLDGTGPFFARETASAENFREVVARALSQALPPPTAWQQQPVASAVARPRRRARDELGHPSGVGIREPEPPFRRFQLTLQTEAVVGTTQGGFYNHLVGARLDVRITRELLLGAYVAYGNLQGRDDRVHNLLLLVQGEYRVRPAAGLDLTIPLRVAAGYLPYNGPVIRIAAGLNYAFSEDFEIGIDLVTPTFWILPDEVAVSMDFAIDVTYRLPWM